VDGAQALRRLGRFIVSRSGGQAARIASPCSIRIGPLSKYGRVLLDGGGRRPGEFGRSRFGHLYKDPASASA
jgi:hypothetical protein